MGLQLLVQYLVSKKHLKEWERFWWENKAFGALLLTSVLRTFAKNICALRVLFLLKRATASLLLIVFTKGKVRFCCTLNGQRLVANLALS